MRSRNKDNETLNVHLDGTRCVTRFMKKKCVNIAYAYVQLPSYDILRTEHDKL